MPNRSQKRQHDLAYRFLAQRDGENCFLCRKKPPWTPLQIDHLDNDPSNWEPENLHLLCQTDNLSLRHKTREEKRFIFRFYSAKNERERARASGRVSHDEIQGTATAKDVVNFMSGSPEMQANNIYEPRWYDWIFNYLTEYGSMPKEEAVYSGAVIAGNCSPLTTQRYLKKATSALGALKINKDENGVENVMFKYPVCDKGRKGKQP